MLETRELTYYHLLKGIHLKFFPGRLYGILGPNGSGKSTFFKAMSKIWHPTYGGVYWHGSSLHEKERKEISKTLSLVPQEIQIHFDFTVKEVVEMGRYAHEEHHKNRAELLEYVLKTVDAWHLMNRKITHLSIGERQRVYIARALMTESPILLLDEPSSNLDIKHQLKIWQLLQTLTEQNKTILVATHDIAGVQRFCTDVAVLNRGVCIAQGTTEEVLTQKLLADVFGVEEQSGQFALAT